MKIKSQFIRNASVLTLGTLLAQVFNFAIYPILGRLFSPIDFALLANVTSLCTIFTVIGTGKYEMSIVLSTKRNEAINIMILCVLLSSFVLGTFGLIFIFFGDKIVLLLKDQRLYPFLFLSLGTSFAIIIFNCYNEWCIYTKKFNGLAINKINNSAAISISKAVCGYPYPIPNGLVWGDFIGRWISAFGCIYRLFKSEPHFIRSLKISELLRLSKRFINFPKFILPGQLINAISTAAPVFLISYFYAAQETGYYSMALTLLILPITIVSNALKDVLRQKVVTKIAEGSDCRPLIIKMIIPLSLVCLCTSLVAYPLLPHIFSIFLGTKWVVSGEYCQILLIMIGVEFIAMALNGVLLAAEKLKIIFFWQIIFLILSTLPIIIGGKIKLDIKSMLTIFSFSRAIGYILYIYLTFRFLPKPQNTSCANDK